MRSLFSTLPSALVVAALASISLIYAAQRSGCSASHQRTPYDFGLGSPLLASCRCQIGASRMCHRLRMRQQSSIAQAESAFLLCRITCTIRTNGADWGDYPFIHRHRWPRCRYSSLRKMAYAPHVGVLAATFLYSSSFPGHTDVRETNAIPQP
ncbi:hypothetical protein B0H14DRAFT_3161393 [Mycena olivaceomarginata]|nr:hypothetical protein B0H14DRAFT_3161393 [Mycena olivaceomarginata]